MRGPYHWAGIRGLLFNQVHCSPCWGSPELQITPTLRQGPALGAARLGKEFPGDVGKPLLAPPRETLEHSKEKEEGPRLSVSTWRVLGGHSATCFHTACPDTLPDDTISQTRGDFRLTPVIPRGLSPASLISYPGWKVGDDRARGRVPSWACPVPPSLIAQEERQRPPH